MQHKEEELNNQIGGTLTENKGEQLLERIPVPDTPFMIMKNDGKYFVTFGQYRVSELYEDIDDIDRLIYEKDYNFLLNLMFAVFEITNKQNEKQ